MSRLVTDNLPLVAGAPGGILRVRELILELAVRGKLLAQNPADEPADALLRRIAAHKTRLVSLGNLGNPKEFGGLADSKIAFRIPPGWAKARFCDLATEVSTGPFGSLIHQSDYVHGGVPLINPSHMINGQIRADLSVSLPPEKAQQLSAYRLNRGDIVMARRGEVGRVAIVTEEEDGWLCGTGSFVLRFVDEISRPYIRTLFSCNSVRTYLACAAVGTTMVNLNHGILQRLPVAVPPLAEQHRIVAKVDELMALCDSLEVEQGDAETAHARLVEALLGTLTQARDAADFADSWKLVAENFHELFTSEKTINRLRKAILQLAISGRLVEQRYTDEPASAFAQRIQVDKSKKSKRRGSDSEVARSSPTGESLPSGWVWSDFGSLTICRDGERIPVSQVDREHRAKTFDYYGASGVIDKIDNYLFDKPLLLIGEDGANLINRSTPIAFVASGKYWVNNHAHVIDAINTEFLRYLELYINATDLRPYVTGTAQPKMNQAKMNAIPIALPPEAEQHRIVAKVDELMALCDLIKAELVQARKLHERLASTLVEQAVV